MSLYYPAQINFEQLRLEPSLARQAKGGLYCKLTYGKGGKVSIQTPKIKAPSGIMAFDDENRAGGKKYSLMLSLGADASATDAERKALEQFDQFWAKMDEKIVEEALRHINSDGASKDWCDTYKKKYSQEVFEEGFYRHFRKQGVNKKTNEPYPPCISIKMNPFKGKDDQETFRTTFWEPTSDGKEVQLVVRDQDGVELPKSPDFIQQFIPPHAHVEAILDIEGVWVVDKKVSLSVKLNACRVHMPTVTSGPRFLPSTGADSDMGDVAEEMPSYLQANDADDSVAASAAASDDAEVMDAAVASSSSSEPIAAVPEAKKPRASKK